MTSAQDRVQDDEQLYRRIRSIAAGQQCFRIESGRTVFTVAAFLDPDKKPSVDRAKLQKFNPNHSRIDQTDGVIELTADKVRGIGLISQKDDNGRTRSEHAVDIEPDPLKEDLARGIKENRAHAVIVTQPPLTASSAFKRLKDALARLATEAGWRIEPGAELPGR